MGPDMDKLLKNNDDIIVSGFDIICDFFICFIVNSYITQPRLIIVIRVVTS